MKPIGRIFLDQHTGKYEVVLDRNLQDVADMSKVYVEDIWQPIETAPKDGTVIQVYENGNIYQTSWTNDVYEYQGGSGGYAGWFSGTYRDHYGDYPIMDYPTHWMPLPKPPKGN